MKVLSKPKLTKKLIKHNTEKVEVNDDNNETDKADEVDRNENNKENTKRYLQQIIELDLNASNT